MRTCRPETRAQLAIAKVYGGIAIDRIEDVNTWLP